MPQTGGVKTAIVLAGGGSLGAVQVGMLKALTRQRIVPDFVVGASVGAINGAYFAVEPNEEGVTRLEKARHDAILPRRNALLILILQPRVRRPGTRQFVTVENSIGARPVRPSILHYKPALNLLSLPFRLALSILMLSHFAIANVSAAGEGRFFLALSSGVSRPCCCDVASPRATCCRTHSAKDWAGRGLEYRYPCPESHS